jgi:glycosyltransferase involved in cell wall biosynthesis
VNQKLSISAFFPAYNDAGTIASMVVTSLLTLRELCDDYEVIVINDGSRDHTPHVLDELARIYPNEVRIVHHVKNRGYGGALRSGFKAATKEWIFYTDGDAQ